MDTSLDDSFKKIKNQKWLPFIGQNYLSTPDNKKLLIVGESHYHNGTQGSIDKHNDPNYTRIVVKELAIQREYWGTKIFPNFHMALFGNDSFDTDAFWNLTSYYNFVQRPMITNKGRPSKKDYYEGWLVFFKTLKIIKPSSCLFIGVESSNSLRKVIQQSDFELISFEKDNKINRTFPRRVTIKGTDSQQIDLVFIKHSSRYFSWDKWNEYITTNLSEQINWFRKKIN
ncbi:MAG: hypothetical protein ACJATI_005206 [Halioglobus sp.]|jgi:hypothetical protein